MTEASVIVDDALELMGAASDMSPADPAQQSKGFDVLCDMIAEWIQDDIDICIIQPYEISDDIGEERHMKQSITALVCKKLAGFLQVDLEDHVLMLIKEAENRLLQFAPNPDVKYPSNLPVGQGNRSVRGRTFFKGS